MTQEKKRKEKKKNTIFNYYFSGAVPRLEMVHQPVIAADLQLSCWPWGLCGREVGGGVITPSLGHFRGSVLLLLP